MDFGVLVGFLCIIPLCEIHVGHHSTIFYCILLGLLAYNRSHFYTKPQDLAIVLDIGDNLFFFTVCHFHLHFFHSTRMKGLPWSLGRRCVVIRFLSPLIWGSPFWGAPNLVLGGGLQMTMRNGSTSSQSSGHNLPCPHQEPWALGVREGPCLLWRWTIRHTFCALKRRWWRMALWGRGMVCEPNEPTMMCKWSDGACVSSYISNHP